MLFRIVQPIAFLLFCSNEVLGQPALRSEMRLNPGQGRTDIPFRDNEGSVKDQIVTIKGSGKCVPQVKCGSAGQRGNCKEDYVMIVDPTENELTLSKDDFSGYWAKSSGPKKDLELHIHKCPDSSLGYTCQAQCECSCSFGADEILLSLGRKTNVSLTFNGPPIVKTPIDLYYLADYTRQMKPELGRFLKHESEIRTVLLKYAENQDLRFGTGLFVEKEEDYRKDDFSYRNVQALDSDWGKSVKAIRSALDDPRDFNGGLPPESQLDAIYQAAKCTEKIGWRTSDAKPRVTKIMVLITDCTYWDNAKFAEKPAPSACYLDSTGLYANSQTYNYPSVNQIAELVKKASIDIALTIALTPEYRTYTDRNVVIDYTALTKAIGSSANLAYLDHDWSNLAAIIEDKYGAIHQGEVKMHIEGVGAGPEIRLTYYSRCNRKEVQSTACNQAGFLDPKFIVEVELVSCPKSGTNTLRQVQFNLVGGPGETQKRIKKFRLDCGKNSG